MNDELNKQLAELVSAAKSAGQDAFAFIQQQAPDVVNQIVAWKMAAGWMQIGVAAFLAVVVFAFVMNQRRMAAKEEYEHRRDVYHTVSWVVGVVIFVITVPLCSCGIYDVLKAKTAPKLVVMEQIGPMLRGR